MQDQHSQTNELPAKTCSIERLVTVKADVEKLLQGRRQLHAVMGVMRM